MKGIFIASLGFPLQLCCIKCSPTLTGILVLVYVSYFGQHCSPTLTRIFVVLLNVDDLHLLGVLVFGCVARCNE